VVDYVRHVCGFVDVREVPKVRLRLKPSSLVDVADYYRQGEWLDTRDLEVIAAMGDQFYDLVPYGDVPLGPFSEGATKGVRLLLNPNDAPALESPRGGSAEMECVVMTLCCVKSRSVVLQFDTSRGDDGGLWVSRDLAVAARDPIWALVVGAALQTHNSLAEWSACVLGTHPNAGK
jgi:hypothetical protein